MLWLTTLVNVALFWLAWLVVGTALSGGRDVTSHELSVGVLAYGAAGMSGPLLGRLVLYRALAHVGPGRIAAGGQGESTPPAALDLAPRAQRRERTRGRRAAASAG